MNKKHVLLRVQQQLLVCTWKISLNSSITISTDFIEFTSYRNIESESTCRLQGKYSWSYAEHVLLALITVTDIITNLNGYMVRIVQWKSISLKTKISKLSVTSHLEHSTSAFNQPSTVSTTIVGGYTESDPSAIPQHQWWKACLALHHEVCRAKEVKGCRLILALQQKTNMIQQGRGEILLIWCTAQWHKNQNEDENLRRGKARCHKKEPAEVEVREATRADDSFTKLRSAILNAIFTTINSKGRNGAPPQSIKQ